MDSIFDVYVEHLQPSPGPPGSARSLRRSSSTHSSPTRRASNVSQHSLQLSSGGGATHRSSVASSSRSVQIQQGEPRNSLSLISEVVLCRVQCTLVPCTVYLVPCTVYLVPCTVNLVPCTVHRAPCTMYHVVCSMRLFDLQLYASRSYLPPH